MYLGAPKIGGKNYPEPEPGVHKNKPGSLFFSIDLNWVYIHLE
jgi:hypothetical protein